MPLSFHVIFFYHAALLFRVPTWGLVFFIYALLCHALSSPSFIIPVLYHFVLYILHHSYPYILFILCYPCPSPRCSLSSSSFILLILYHQINIAYHPYLSSSFTIIIVYHLEIHPYPLSSSSFIILILFLFLINIQPFLSPPPTPEKSLCIPYINCA